MSRRKNFNFLDLALKHQQSLQVGPMNGYSTCIQCNQHIVFSGANPITSKRIFKRNGYNIQADLTLCSESTRLELRSRYRQFKVSAIEKGSTRTENRVSGSILTSTGESSFMYSGAIGSWKAAATSLAAS